MSELVFLKLGGSLITDKAIENSFRTDVCRRLGIEIRRAVDASSLRLVLGHGGGSIAHAVAHRYRTAEGLAGGGGWTGFAETRRAVTDLNGRVLAALAESGMRPICVAPSSIGVASGGRLKRLDAAVIHALLERGQTPLVFGDAVVDEEWGFTICSTEVIFGYLVERLNPSRVLLACDVDGVFAANPLDNPEAQRIPVITDTGLPEVRGQIARDGRADVTGGMLGKLNALMELASNRNVREIRIFSGLIPGAVEKALLGEYAGGTVVQNAS